MTQEELPYHLIVSKTVATTDTLKANMILMDIDELYNWLLSNTSKLTDIFAGDRKLYISFNDRKAAKDFLSILTRIHNQESRWVKFQDSDHWYLLITLD